LTVAIGLVCANGVVVASDSMSTSGGVAQKGQKVQALSNLPVVWTASGSVYVIEDVAASLDALDQRASNQAQLRWHFASPNLPQVRTELSDSVRGAMQGCYTSGMPGYQMLTGPGGQQRHPFGSDFLLLGYAGDTPYFLEVAHDGQLNWHHEVGFYAVGSGGEFASVARALMAHYVEGEDLPVELGLQLAYRTIANTIDVSSQYVGFPVQLAVVDSDGARVLDEGDVELVKQGVQGWMKLESELLRKQAASEPPPLEEPPTIVEDEPYSGSHQ
jgi:proteasome beta subunit